MERLLEQDLIKWKNSKNRKPLILKGVRQVGKTYLLKNFGKKFFKNVHYINFEKDKKIFKLFKKDLDPKRILEDLSFILEKTINIKTDLLIFDEIQENPLALTSLKYFQEELPELALCSAGSLLGIYLGSNSFPVGKIDMLTLYPLSFKEFLMAINDKTLSILNNFKKTKYIPEIAHEHLLNRLKHYFITGGMPEAIAIYINFQHDLFQAFNEIRNKQELLITAYFSDMAKHSGKVNAMHLNRLFKNVPAQLEKSIDSFSKKFRFKEIIPGVSHYSRMVSAIDWLENMGLIFKIPIIDYAKIPLNSRCKENTFKLFLFDIGILASMNNLSFKTILNHDYGSYKGYFIENFILQELIASKEKSLFCWNEKKAEIEFLKQQEDKIIPIEIKSGFITQAKSLQVFSKKYNPEYSIIFSQKPFAYKSMKKIYYLPLYLADQISFL